MVKGAHDPHSVGAHRAPESSGSTCYRRRIVWTGVAARYIYRASGPVLAFDGLEMCCRQPGIEAGRFFSQATSYEICGGVLTLSLGADRELGPGAAGQGDLAASSRVYGHQIEYSHP